MLHYSIRAVSAAQPLQGRLLEGDGPAEAEGGDPNLLGAVEGVEAGAATGWACLRNAPTRRVEVRAQSLTSRVTHDSLLHTIFMCLRLFIQRMYKCIAARSRGAAGAFPSSALSCPLAST